MRDGRVSSGPEVDVTTEGDGGDTVVPLRRREDGAGRDQDTLQRGREEEVPLLPSQ